MQMESPNEKNIDIHLTPDILRAHNACLKNADDLIAAAQAVKAVGRHNIAYHLATLALEEIGKAGLIMMSHIVTGRNRSDWAQNKMTNHVAKLFWALFGMRDGHNPITNESVEIHKGLAQNIHDARMRGLYVDIQQAELSIPSEAINIAECDAIIGMATARLEYERARKYNTNISKEHSNLLSWFLKATNDAEKRKYIMCAESIKKQAELNDSISWFRWLKEIFDKQEDECRRLAESEMKRIKPHNMDKQKDKWEITVRIFSDSHSIRQKSLNGWNNATDWIKLYAVDGRQHTNEMIMKIIFPKAVMVDSLYFRGWAIARGFITALNIGSAGFFWWNLSKLRKAYYEEITDLESKANVRLECSPALQINWGKDALLDADLLNTNRCFAHISHLMNTDNREPLDYYYSGLSFMGILDVNNRIENTVFGNFYHALRKSIQIYGCWDGKQPFLNTLMEIFTKIGFEEGDIGQIYQLGESLVNNGPPNGTITLQEIVTAKILCDYHFNRMFQEDKMPLPNIEKRGV